jgi:phenylacetate-CoA ligase
MIRAPFIDSLRAGMSHPFTGIDEELYHELLDRQRWDRARLAEEQARLTSDLVAFASRSVAHYRATLDRSDGLSTAADLERLPILTRDTVRDEGVRLVADGVVPSSLRSVTTGGTTGVPLTLYRPAGDPERENAHVFAGWHRFGVRPGDRVAVVVGRPVGPSGATEKVVASTGTLWLGGDHLDADRLSAHAARIQEYRPTMVRGYPSVLSLLASHMIDTGRPGPDSIVAVGTSSEVLTPWQAEAITRSFGVPIANLYGQSEHVALAVSCPASASLHVDMTYGVVELVDVDGKPIHEPGVVGEIVATGLYNRVAPLIRYATGDRAAWDSGPCGCGLSTPRLSRVDGRTRNVVVDSSGHRHLFGTSFSGLLWRPDAPFARVQFRQDEPGILVVAIRPRPGVDPRAAEAWVRDALENLDGFTVRVSAQERFRTTGLGKEPLFAPAPPD